MTTAPVFRAPTELLGAVAVDGELTLDGPEGRHAAVVRRLRSGEAVELVDGLGLRAQGVVVGVHTARGEDPGITVRVTGTRGEPAYPTRLVLAQALPKGDRGELAVELATEAGVDRILPWAAQRCVTRWEGTRGDRARGRWQAVADEASKQARRARWPVVEEQVGTPALVARCAGAPLALVLHEAATGPLTGVELPTAGEIVVVVGPEGGVSPEELAALTAAGAVAVRLGREVVRTSTAGVMALTLLAAGGRWDHAFAAAE